MSVDGPTLRRRDFLVGAALAGLAGALPPAAGTVDEPPRVRRRVPLGKTELEISDVSFGSSRLRDDEDLVRHVFDRGINCFAVNRMAEEGHRLLA